MTRKILILTKPLIIPFNYLHYEWPLEEQLACCKSYIKDTMPEAEIVVAQSSFDTQEIASSFEKSPIVIPSKLIFSHISSIADVSVKCLTDAGFTVVEVISNGKLASNPLNTSRLLLEGDSKYTSLFYLCSGNYPLLSLKQLGDTLTQYILQEYNALSKSPKTPPSRPNTKALIEHYFKDLNMLTLDQISGRTDDNDSFQDDEDK